MRRSLRELSSAKNRKATELAIANTRKCRAVAQPGRALALGARGRTFKSCPPDGNMSETKRVN